MDAYRRAALVGAFLLAVLSLSAAAQIPGTDYIELASAPKPAAGKLEITEFFMYSCPHCASFRAELEAWRARLPRDATYRRIAVAFRPQLLPHSQMYYTLETLGRADELHGKAFDAVQVARKPMIQPEEQADFFAQLGIDRGKYLDTYRSFGTQAKVRQGSQLVAAFRIDGVPALAINGRYLTSPSRAGGNAQALRVADQLVAQATGRPVPPSLPSSQAGVAGSGERQTKPPPAPPTPTAQTHAASAPAGPGGGTGKSGLPPPQYARRTLTIAACQSFIDRKVEHEGRSPAPPPNMAKYRASVQDHERLMFERQLNGVLGRYAESSIAMQLRGRHVTLEWLNNRIDGKQYVEYERPIERDAIREVLERKLLACQKDALLANVGYSEGPREDYPTPRIRILEAGLGRSR